MIIDIVEQGDQYRIVGLLDRKRTPGEHTLGYPILGHEEDLPQLIQTHGVEGAVVAVGDNFVRADVVKRIRKANPRLPFVRAIHPAASIATDVSVGEGAVIMAGVSINSSTVVGRFCILNTNSSLDHDSTLADFASLGPRAATGGQCHVGEGAAIGIGAIIINGVRIGQHTVIGAGSLVLKAVEPFVVAYGAPAQVIRSRKPGDPYLAPRL